MTIAIRERLEQEVPEGGTAQLSFQIVDGLGAAVPVIALLTLKLTLYDEAVGSAVAGPFINGRNAQSVLNANGGTVTEAAGATTAVLNLAGLDNPIVTAGRRLESHVAYLEWTQTGGAGPGRKEFLFRVRNLSRV